MDSRYLPQIRLKDIGRSGQEKLACAKVLIVGCGALGSPVAMYLAGAGVGNITIADFDNIEFSNLHRQVFFSEETSGLPKVDILKEKILGLNSSVTVNAINSLVTSNLIVTLGRFDVIVDAADNPATTYMLDEFAKKNAIPMVTAGVSGWEAQIFMYIPGSLAYSDIFHRPKDDAGLLPCSVAGIVGATSAYAASVQCACTLRIILGIAGDNSRLITANLLSDSFETSF